MKKIFTLMMVALAAMTVSAQQLYLCGDAPVGNGWGPTADNQVPMTLASDGYTNTASFDVTGQPWFCVSKGGGSSWDDFNANYRYSCSSFNGTQSGTYQFEMLGDNAVSLTAGHYDISIDARSMVMTLTYTPAAAPTTDTYSVVGDVALGVAWEPSSTDLVMTKKSETLYELVRENCTLEANKPYYWRVLVNATTYGWGAHRYGASGYDAGEGDDNVVSTFGESGVYNLTFTLDLSAGAASIPTVTAVKAGEVTYNYLYVSDETGWTTLKVYSWNNSGNEIFGSWGSTTVTGNATEVINGVTYVKVPFLPSADTTANLIFFSGDDTGEGDPTRAQITVTADKDVYVKVTSGHAEVVDPNVYTGIEQVERTVAQPSVYYDLSGRRVSDGYRGVIISNGKKVVVK